LKDKNVKSPTLFYYIKRYSIIGPDGNSHLILRYRVIYSTTVGACRRWSRLTCV